MSGQPSGTVSLLFSDIEASTRLLRQLGAERYGAALARHRELLRVAFDAERGYEVDCEGDSFFVAFPTAVAAVTAASQAQQSLAAEPWPEGCELRVRIGIHTGEPLLAPPKYLGLDVHRAARIMQAGHGGQVLLSQAARDLVAAHFQLRDLGEHRLKDLAQPERLFQLGDAQFPPLTSLRRARLPVVSGALLGRERELAEIRRLFEEGARLVTLTGPGGSGKTRVALQAAGEMAERFDDGTVFVTLAAIEDAAVAPSAVLQALELRPDDDLQEALLRRQLLLVLDNLEQLTGVERLVAEIVATAQEVRVLTTSRAPLGLSAEYELSIGPLDDDAAAELFLVRAASAGRRLSIDEAVRSICRRLDNLPLAIELAAANTKVLAPAAMLTRLDRVLPVLTRGPRDAPLRQQTLRATIDWSYRLLSEGNRTLLRRLAVFRGSFHLPAAEMIAGATVEALAALIDQSLLKAVDEERFLMLETLREYAREQLQQSGENEEISRAHARFFVQLAEDAFDPLHGPEQGATVKRLLPDLENLRGALSWSNANERNWAVRMAGALGRFWWMQGLGSEADGWLEEVLAADHPSSPELRRALLVAGHFAMDAGDLPRARSHYERALELARDLGDARAVSDMVGTLGQLAREEGDFISAWRHFEEWLQRSEAIGHTRGIATALANLGGLAVEEGDYQQAASYWQRSVATIEEVGDPAMLAEHLYGLAYAQTLLNERGEAKRVARQALSVAIESRDRVTVLGVLLVIAAVWAEDDPEMALGLLAGEEAARRELRVRLDGAREGIRRHALENARGRLGGEDWMRSWKGGETRSFDALVQWAVQATQGAEASTIQQGQ